MSTATIYHRGFLSIKMEKRRPIISHRGPGRTPDVIAKTRAQPIFHAERRTLEAHFFIADDGEGGENSVDDDGWDQGIRRL